METGGTDKRLPGPDRQLVPMELFISRVLRAGVTACGIITAIGLLWLLLAGQSTSAFPSTMTGIWQGILAGQPSAVIDVGLIILILTPVFWVAASVLLFLRERDYLYAGITFFVLCMLILSFTLGQAGG